MSEHYGRLDPQVMQYIHEREQQASKGITDWARRANTWEKPFEPYQPYFKQFGYEPQQVISSLANAHLILKHGTPEQKAQAIQLLDRDYGLRQFFQQGQGGQPGNVAPQPWMEALQPLANQVQQIQAVFQQQQRTQAEGAVEKFIGDPGNKYMPEVIDDVIRLIEQGTAPDLPTAYRIATAMNPAVQEKIIAERITAASAPRGAPMPKNIRQSAVPSRNSEKSTGTMEDTMREALRAITSR
jgi:hypothetical protein